MAPLDTRNQGRGRGIHKRNAEILKVYEYVSTIII